VKKLAIVLCLAVIFVMPAIAQTVDPCTQTTKLSGGTTYTDSKREKLPNSPYTYEIWTEAGGGNTVTWYGPNAGGGAAFRATWNGASTDFLGRIGFHYGNGGTFSSYNYVYADYNYTRSGNNTGGSYSYIGLYGWTANSVVEWYIVEDWYGNGILNSTGILGTEKGSFTASTGATYKIYKNTRPAGSGCVGCNGQAFPQYFSVRQRANSDPSKPMCGTVYVQEHFEAFEKYNDMKMGTSMYEISWLNESAARNSQGWYELTYLSLTKENQKRGTSTPSSGSTGGTSSNSNASSSSAEKVQATTCKTPLITYPTTTVPADPYTACFKYTNDKCYVCKIENEGEFEGNMNTCASGWVWDGTQIASNLADGYWYQEVPCPGSTPILQNHSPITYFAIQTQSDKSLRIEISSPAVMEIFDLKGKKVEKFNISSTSQTVKLSLPNGVYFAKVKGMKSVRFVLK